MATGVNRALGCRAQRQQIMPTPRFAGEKEIDDAISTLQVRLENRPRGQAPFEREVGIALLEVGESGRNLDHQPPIALHINEPRSWFEPAGHFPRRIDENGRHDRAVAHQRRGGS